MSQKNNSVKIKPITAWMDGVVFQYQRIQSIKLPKIFKEAKLFFKKPKEGNYQKVKITPIK